MSDDLIGKGVHVEGWNKACVFVLERIEGGKNYLITPRTGKRCTTTNNVYPTWKQKQKDKNHECG